MKKFRNYEVYALVTGAASGMGRIYSQRLALMGYNVIMVDINSKGLEETAATVTAGVNESGKVPEDMKGRLHLISIVQDLSAMDAADPRQQFAFVAYEGKHYLYSVSEKKFVAPLPTLFSKILQVEKQER